MAFQQPTPQHSLDALRRLLGGEPGKPEAMHQYIVNLAPPPPPSPGSPRSAAVDAATRVAVAFVDLARKELAERGLADEVGGFGEPYGLPVVTMTATEAVAAIVRELSGVTAVYQDDAIQET